MTGKEVKVRQGRKKAKERKGGVKKWKGKGKKSKRNK